MAVAATCSTALKEWAVAIRALGDGRQVLILRKGGIREEGNRFRVSHPEFLLYPTYEHQQIELLKDEQSPGATLALDSVEERRWVTFTHFAQVHRAFAVSELDELRALAPHHIWSDAYAEKRLRWRPRVALTAMVLRVHRLEAPQRVPVLPEYEGCRSWLELREPVALGRLTPALEDEAFGQRSTAVEQAVEASAPILS